MKVIDTNNPFFQNIQFLRDKYKFSLIGHNLEIDETLIYSDEENYIFVVGKSHKPIWLWTIDNISKEKIFEIKDCIDYFSTNGLTSFACKESLYSELGLIYGNLGLIPVLSTDYDYMPSNKCYQNVGYQLDDKLVIFSNELY